MDNRIETINNDWEYDSKWADRPDFLKSLKRIDLQNVSEFDSGGVPLSSDGRIAFVDDTDSHSLIIGATGSKKTRLVAMPTLQILARTGESFVVTDPKGELYDNSYAILKEHNYKILVVNFRDPSKGNSWNPLFLPYQLYKSNDPINKDKARELLDDFAHNIFPGLNVKDPFWESSSQDFFLGLVELLFKNSKSPDEINLRNVCSLKAQAMAGNSNELKNSYYYQNIIDKNSFEYICLNGTVEAPENTRRSILSTFNQNMRIFSAQDALVDMLSSNDIDFSSLGNEKTALFLIIPDEKTTYHKLVSIFIKQCYEHLIMDAQKLDSKALPIRVNFVLDEFSSLPKVSDFPAMITAARSRNIRFDLFIQSAYQLRAKYGEDSETIKSNCNNWLFLTSRELPLLKEISELAGKKQRETPLISVSKLQRLKKEKGEVLVFHGRTYPHVSILADISEYPIIKSSVVMQTRTVHKTKNFDFSSIAYSNDSNVVSDDYEFLESSEKNAVLEMIKDINFIEWSSGKIEEIMNLGVEFIDSVFFELKKIHFHNDSPFLPLKKYNYNTWLNIGKILLHINSLPVNKESIGELLFDPVLKGECYDINCINYLKLCSIPDKYVQEAIIKAMQNNNYIAIKQIVYIFDSNLIFNLLKINLSYYFAFEKILHSLKKNDEKIAMKRIYEICSKL